MTERILVTGPAGFLGATFVHCALSRGAKIGLFLRPASSLIRLQDVMQRCDVFLGDVRDVGNIEAAIGTFRPNCIVHCASTLWVKPGQSDLALHFDVNAVGTLRLLEAAKSHGLRLIYTGSSSVYGEGAARSEDLTPPHPNSVYAVSKLAVSNLIKLYGEKGCDCLELRVFAPYGPLDAASRLLQFVISKALRNEPLELTSGRQRRDWVYADDVADALWLAAGGRGTAGDVINIGGGHSVSVRETVELVLDVLGRSRQIARFGARPDRPDEMYDNEAVIKKGAELLGWTPHTALREGIVRTAAYMQEYRAIAEQLA